MIDLGDVLRYAYWLAIIALVVWWVRGMRRAAKPATRSALEELELSRVRAALARLDAPDGVTRQAAG